MEIRFTTINGWEVPYFKALSKEFEDFFSKYNIKINLKAIKDNSFSHKCKYILCAEIDNKTFKHTVDSLCYIDESFNTIYTECEEFINNKINNKIISKHYDDDLVSLYTPPEKLIITDLDDEPSRFR